MTQNIDSLFMYLLMFQEILSKVFLHNTMLDFFCVEYPNHNIYNKLL